MNKMTNVTLEDAVEAARKLPVETQEAVAAELMEYVEDLSTPNRPSERQAIIKERIERPLKAISRDQLMAMLRQYNPAI